MNHQAPHHPPADDARSPVVSCDEVALTFGRGERAVVAVHGSTCRVEPRDRVAVVGPSGSGKSTLLHIMAGLERPTAGQVTWPALSSRADDRVREIGVVFQSPSLVPSLTVTENVALPLVLAGLDIDETTDRVRRAVELVALKRLADQLPEELSGGQAQRVAVARVLAQRPALVLADEPTGQLDRPTGQHLVDVLVATADEIGAALVLTTHDVEVADRLDVGWSMHEGRLHVDPRSSRPEAVPRSVAVGSASPEHGVRR